MSLYTEVCTDEYVHPMFYVKSSADQRRDVYGGQWLFHGESHPPCRRAVKQKNFVLLG